jgi:hypothetical protein
MEVKSTMQSHLKLLFDITSTYIPIKTSHVAKADISGLFVFFALL